LKASSFCSCSIDLLSEPDDKVTFLKAIIFKVDLRSNAYFLCNIPVSFGDLTITEVAGFVAISLQHRLLNNAAIATSDTKDGF